MIMDIKLIETIAQISSILGVIALGLVLYFFFRRAKLSKDKEIIEQVDSKDRGKIVERYLGKSRVSTEAIDKMTENKKSDIILKELDLEKHQVNNNLKLILGVGLLAVAGYWISTSVPVENSDIKLLKCFRDTDGDGYGDPNYVLETESGKCPENYVDNSDDTDDSDKLRYKGEKIWYKDSDGDGYGSPKNSKISVTKPEDFVDNSEDIDDDNKNRNIEALEKTWYLDADKDGFGDESKPIKSIPQPENNVLKIGDFDDGDSNVFPGQTKFFNTPSKSKKIWDYNCDGKIEHQYTQAGRCDDGRANPQGWLGPPPNCGQVKTWLKDCDRKLRGFPPKLEIRHETEPRKQACR